MTIRLSVERTIGDGYIFAFTQFLSVLGTVWLPYLLLAAATVGLVLVAMPDLPRMVVMNELDVPGLLRLGRIAVLVGILGFIADAMVAVGLQRKALGLHPRPVYAWFSLGAAVWRMAAALFLAMLVIFFIVLLTGGVCVAIWFAAQGLGGAMWFVRVLNVCAGAAFVFYIAVRLLFFLPAVVVAEETIGLERAWILGGHNFWRVVIVVIAVVVPVAIGFHILSWAIFGPFAVLPAMGHMSLREITRGVLLQFGAVGPFVLLFQLLERIVLLGVINGVVASAYLAVSGKKPGLAPASPVSRPGPDAAA
ncbi:MAG TPA: hypothetical protein VHX61_06150 [Rhizomicrobium sp.]|jgi:hypothetical protein|nr:hypothetical protein [Rhizomicrobium sp.]